MSSGLRIVPWGSFGRRRRSRHFRVVEPIAEGRAVESLCHHNTREDAQRCIDARAAGGTKCITPLVIKPWGAA